KMNLVHKWIRSCPDVQKAAIMEGVESASLVKTRRALRLLEELDPEQRGPRLDVEILSTYNLEPLLPVLQLAMSCAPSQACAWLGPLDNIEAHIAQPDRSHAPAVFDARIIIWRIEVVLPEALYPFSHGFPERLGARVDLVLERIERLVGLHRRNAPGIPLFLSTVALPVNIANPLFAAQHYAGPFASVTRINQKMYEVAAQDDGVHLLHLASWPPFDGRGHRQAMVD